MSGEGDGGKRSAEWRLVQQIVAVLEASRDLEEDLAEAIAEDAIAHQSLRGGPGNYLDAIRNALDSDADLTMTGVHSERSIRAFLTLISRALERRRPWPAPTIRKMPADDWAQFKVPVGLLDETRIGTQYHIGQRFDRLRVGDGERHLMLLRLATGEEVGLFAPSDVRERGIILRQRQPADPGLTLKHFAEAAGYSETAIRPVDIPSDA